MEDELFSQSSYTLIMRVLQKYSRMCLQMLALRHNVASVHIQKGFLVEQLTQYYYNKNCTHRSAELTDLLYRYFRGYDDDQPVLDTVDFTHEESIKRILLQEIIRQRTTDNGMITMVYAFYNSVQTINAEQDSRYSMFIEPLYNAVSEIEYIIRQMYADRETRTWKIVPHILVCYKRNGKVDCPLCYETAPMKRCVFTGCNHTFCHRCFSELLKHTDIHEPPVCPLCRTPIDTIHTLSKEIYQEYDTA